MNNQLLIDFIIGFLVSAAGVLISFLSELLRLKRTKRKKEETTEDRIRRLTNSLREPVGQSSPPTAGWLTNLDLQII